MLCGLILAPEVYVGLCSLQVAYVKVAICADSQDLYHQHAISRAMLATKFMVYWRRQI